MVKSMDDLTHEERLAWLRERGIRIETVEDRKHKQIRDILNGKELNINDEDYEDLSIVQVPHDESLPLKELSIKVPLNRLGKGDFLLEELKPYFSSSSRKIDMSLFESDETTKTFGSIDIRVAGDEVQKAADEGQVEVFCLVHPMPSNEFQSVNIYLDEAGMLKRLPMNKRAANFALRAGFNPAPKFYGDVFIGRLKNLPKLKNVSFKFGADTSPDAKWIQNATLENIEYQMEMDKISRKGNKRLQPNTDGENGIPKEEQEGYSWTQTDEEIEIVLPLNGAEEGKALTSKEVKAGGLKVKYYPRKLEVSFQKREILKLDLFSSVDPDGCTWTLEVGNDKKATRLVITCEKNDDMSWPRITF